MAGCFNTNLRNYELGHNKEFSTGYEPLCVSFVSKGAGHYSKHVPRALLLIDSGVCYNLFYCVLYCAFGPISRPNDRLIPYDSYELVHAFWRVYDRNVPVFAG